MAWSPCGRTRCQRVCRSRWRWNVDNTGHLDNVIQMAELEGVPGIKVVNVNRGGLGLDGVHHVHQRESLFVIVFLASVSSKDHRVCLEAFGIKLISDFFIVPTCVAALFTFIVWMWMWVQHTQCDVHTFVTNEYTLDLNFATNSPTYVIAAPRVSARNVHGANDEEARTIEPLAVVVVSEREAASMRKQQSHVLPADESELALVPHVSDDTAEREPPLCEPASDGDSSGDAKTFNAQRNTYPGVQRK